MLSQEDTKLLSKKTVDEIIRHIDTLNTTIIETEYRIRGMQRKLDTFKKELVNYGDIKVELTNTLRKRLNGDASLTDRRGKGEEIDL